MAAIDANMYSLLQTPYLHIRHWLPSLITKNALYAHKMTTSKTHQKTQLSVEIPPQRTNTPTCVMHHRYYFKYLFAILDMMVYSDTFSYKRGSSTKG